MIGLTPFILLCTSGFLAIFSSTISKSPVLPLFASSLGANPSGIGLVAGVSAFTGIVMSIPAGMLSDRFGRRRMLIASSCVFATAPVLYLFVTSIWQLALARLYHGVATAIFVPVSMAFVSASFHHERGEKIGWFSTATLLGRFGAPIVGGSLIGLFAAAPMAGFRAVYIVCAIAGTLTLLLALRLPTDAAPESSDHDWSRTFAVFRIAIGNPTILVTAAVEASILFAYGTFETFLPIHAIKAGLTAYEVGILLSSQIITLALTKPIMGRFSDRHGRRPQIIFGALFGAVCIGSVGMLYTFPLFLVSSILFGLSLSIVTSATAAHIADVSSRDGLGSAMGILGSIMDIGHTTGPIVAGVIATTYGFGSAFLAAAAVVLIICVLFVGLAERSTRESRTT